MGGHLGHRAELQHPPAGHDADVRAVLGHVRQDVRRHDQRLALLAQLAQELAELHPAGRVEPGGGLVEQHDRRAGQHRPRDADPLPHAARQRLDLLSRLLGQPDLLQPEVDPLADLGRRHVVALGDEAEVVADGELLVHRGRVRREPDPAERLGRAGHERLAVDAHHPAAGRLEPGGGAEERGLARAVGADQPEQVAAVQVERDPADRQERPELDADLFQGEENVPPRRRFAHAAARLRHGRRCGKRPAGRAPVTSRGRSVRSWRDAGPAPP
ncbi:MAG: hypothetical protein AVDCRST_MAG64-1369 [uncultured Phycisphaerae bacterium]|uniref:Uncharacterized protein n=1 Tax=uncultured Phycisphaerae bacterium TaxID=904963 RepID=A0A6J4NQJ8_9BACT|nr:MAG: hypothetical protein AVDCRST_MAG64-1369 [uncultured Phycisphaerae bacterium]